LTFQTHSPKSLMSIDILSTLNRDFQMGTVVITWAKGHSGGSAIDRLLEQAREVRALAHANRCTSANISASVSLVEATTITR